MINFASKCKQSKELAPKRIVSPEYSMGAINNNGFVCIKVHIKE